MENNHGVSATGSPDEIARHRRATLTCFTTDRHRPASDCARTWARRVPEDPLAWRLLALSQVALGDRDGALASARQSALAAPDDPAAAALVAEISEGLDLKPPSSLPARIAALPATGASIADADPEWVDEPIRLHTGGQRDRAWTLLDERLATTPDAPAVWCLRAFLHMLEHDTDSSLASIDTALLHAPGYADAWWLRLYLEIPGYAPSAAERITVAQGLIAAAPRLRETYAHLSDLLLDTGDVAEASEVAEAGLRMAPTPMVAFWASRVEADGPAEAPHGVSLWLRSVIKQYDERGFPLLQPAQTWAQLEPHEPGLILVIAHACGGLGMHTEFEGLVRLATDRGVTLPAPTREPIIDPIAGLSAWTTLAAIGCYALARRGGFAVDPPEPPSRPLAVVVCVLVLCGLLFGMPALRNLRALAPLQRAASGVAALATVLVGWLAFTDAGAAVAYPLLWLAFLGCAGFGFTATIRGRRARA